MAGVEGGPGRPREQGLRLYRRLSILGRGAFGTVSKVQRQADGCVCVIKQIALQGLSSKELAESLNEARVMRRTSHPNIVTYMDSFVDHETLFIVMEYAPGGDLAQLIAGQRGLHLDEERIWKYFIQTCTGLQYLHSHRILHRDLKPHNVFLSSADHVKIGDLGFGRMLSRGEDWAVSGVGTPLYYSPELCEEKPYNDRSDVWALGCLLFELAALHPPFRATNQIALARKIVRAEPPPLPPQYSVEMQYLLSRLLEKGPDARPTAAQVLSYPAVSVRAELIQHRATVAMLQRQLYEREAKLRDETARAERAEQQLLAATRTASTHHEEQNRRTSALVHKVLGQAKLQDGRLRSWAQELADREGQLDLLATRLRGQMAELKSAAAGAGSSAAVPPKALPPALPARTPSPAPRPGIVTVTPLVVRHQPRGGSATPRSTPSPVSVVASDSSSNASPALTVASVSSLHASLRRAVPDGGAVLDAHDAPHKTPSGSRPPAPAATATPRQYDASAYAGGNVPELVPPVRSAYTPPPPPPPPVQRPEEPPQEEADGAGAEAEAEAGLENLQRGLDRANFRESTKQILKELLLDLCTETEAEAVGGADAGGAMALANRPPNRTLSQPAFTASPGETERGKAADGLGAAAEAATAGPPDATPPADAGSLAGRQQAPKRPRRQLAFGSPQAQFGP